MFFNEKPVAEINNEDVIQDNNEYILNNNYKTRYFALVKA